MDKCSKKNFKTTDILAAILSVFNPYVDRNVLTKRHYHNNNNSSAINTHPICILCAVCIFHKLKTLLIHAIVIIF